MELMTTKLAHELKNPLAAIKSLTQVEAKHANDDNRGAGSSRPRRGRPDRHADPRYLDVARRSSKRPSRA